jgi:hypothetical protein
MSKRSGIWFVDVPPGHQKLDEGQWFWDPGAYVLCGAASCGNSDQWILTGLNQIANREPLPREVAFSDLDSLIKFVSEYYGRPVFDVDPEDMPDPEEL